MTLFEIIICIVVAAMFFAATFVFIACISYIKQVYKINKQVVTLTNAAYECRSFLEKVSKHEVITKINKITDLEKKVGELIGICKNQTNNITEVRDNLDKTLEDIKMRNNMIRDNHKLLYNINVKTSKMKDDIDKIGEITVDINKSSFINYDKIVNDITYIREKFGETSVDSEKEVIDIDKKLEEILSCAKRCNSGVSALIEAHNKNIDFTRESFKGINDTLSNFSDAIDNVAKTNKINNEDIAKISSILDSYREKVNYITTYIENATKLKTASKTKTTQTTTIKRPIIEK